MRRELVVETFKGRNDLIGGCLSETEFTKNVSADRYHFPASGAPARHAVGRWLIAPAKRAIIVFQQTERRKTTELGRRKVTAPPHRAADFRINNVNRSRLDWIQFSGNRIQAINDPGIDRFP